MKKLSRRGLSPVVSVILLSAIAVALAFYIYNALYNRTETTLKECNLLIYDIHLRKNFLLLKIKNQMSEVVTVNSIKIVTTSGSTVVTINLPSGAEISSTDPSTSGATLNPGEVLSVLKTGGIGVNPGATYRIVVVTDKGFAEASVAATP